jgi:hypothetical protein
MAEGETAQEASMEEWMAWFGTLGAAVLDLGNPFGPAKSIARDGTVGDGGRGGLTGYSIVEAADLEAAAALVQGCPVLSSGGNVDVYEAIPVG